MMRGDITADHQATDVSIGRLSDLWCGAQDDSYPSVSWKSNVRDGLCCNSTRTNQPFQAMGLDFVLINGILQPTIRMEARPLPGPAQTPWVHCLSRGGPLMSLHAFYAFLVQANTLLLMQQAQVSWQHLCMCRGWHARDRD